MQPLRRSVATEGGNDCAGDSASAARARSTTRTQIQMDARVLVPASEVEALPFVDPKHRDAAACDECQTVVNVPARDRQLVLVAVVRALSTTSGSRAGPRRNAVT